MKVCFQADADLNAEIVAGVLRREPRIDFQTADEAHLRGVLNCATHAGLSLFSMMGALDGIW